MILPPVSKDISLFTFRRFLFFICSLGNEAFSKKDFKTAIEFYTKAILQEPSNHIFFSNRRYVDN